MDKVFRDVKFGKMQTTIAKSFASYGDKVVNGIRSIYRAASDILQEPNDNENYPKILNILEIQTMKHVFNEDGICKLKFFRMVTDNEKYHRHWYRRERDPEVWASPLLSLSFNQDNICVTCKGSYLNEEDWLRCNLFGQCFHERCFMIQDTVVYF